MTVRTLLWTPTIALSWFWGLGFFYSMHVTLVYGWLGFAAFAIPNAVGLGLFGWAVGGRRRAPDEFIKEIEGRYGSLLLMYQLAAVAITLFGFAAYFCVPLIGSAAAIGVALLVSVACAIAQATSIGAMKRLHAFFLALGVGSALVLLAGFLSRTTTAPTPVAAFDARFYGLALPTLIGFLLGPWLDLQQWQRAAAIHRDGASVRGAYAAAGVAFFCLLSINALLAGSIGPGGLVTARDGLPGGESAVAMATSRLGAASSGPAIAYTVWVVMALGTMLMSSYAAIRWFLSGAQSRSLSPLLAFIPKGVASSPLWIIAGGLIIAAAALQAKLSLIYLMVPFATLFVGGAVCFVCEFWGHGRNYDPMLCMLLGAAAAIIFVLGYMVPVPMFLAAAPVIALLGALPAVVAIFAPARPAATSEAAQPALPVAAVATVAAVPIAGEHAMSHGFDGQWFVMPQLPTYDDTNSVGNVYFANYIRWVGKARELFFNICVPDFDLATTRYFILTRSFTHDFRREAKEFEPISVRIRIANHNRKFVTLSHEIYSATQGLLGRGEQSLMFVDRSHGRPLDIPIEIIRGFLPYWPKESRIAQTASPRLRPSPA